MDIETLANQAYDVMQDIHRDLHRTHGIEVAPGFFNLYNTDTGQSKTVLYHPESNMVFKETYTDEPATASKRYIGIVEMLGQTYRVRLPEFYTVEVAPMLSVQVQEYVVGNNCQCGTDWFCEHAKAVSDATRCSDTHVGNWKIVGDEVVLFDFEGIRGLDTDDQRE